MDVNVRNVEEIVRFGHSLNGFLSDYLGALLQVSNGASVDYTKARNCLNSLRSKEEKAKWELKVAERNLEDLIDRSYRNPEEDYSSQIMRRENLLEQHQAEYDEIARALEEAESIVKRVKVNSDRVIEEVNRTRRQLQDTGHNTLSAIKSAASAISNYLNHH